MTQNNLKAELRSLVLQYGFEQVHKHLHNIQTSKPELIQCRQPLMTPPGIENTRTGTRKPKITAPAYVAKMQLPFEKGQTVAVIASKFQEKAFLPTFRDIEHFCQVYDVDVPASRSRANAVPRIFKFIASMDTNDVQRIIAEDMFSGPSRLGPIADAIRSNGRARMSAPK